MKLKFHKLILLTPVMLVLCSCSSTPPATVGGFTPSAAAKSMGGPAPETGLTADQFIQTLQSTPQASRNAYLQQHTQEVNYILSQPTSSSNYQTLSGILKTALN